MVCLYRVVTHHLGEFVRPLRWALTSCQMFEWAKRQHVDTLTDIQRAARLFYLLRLAFGGKVTAQTFDTCAASPRRSTCFASEKTLAPRTCACTGW